MNIKDFINFVEGRRDFGEICWNQRIRAHNAKYSKLKPPLPIVLSALLKKEYSIAELYSHQKRAIEVIRDGKNVVVMTPTSSGKSLIYNLPLLETILKEPKNSSKTHALYIFPLKGLTQNQFKTLKCLAKDLEIENLAAIYDGDTTGYKRRKIRENPPNIILTNPDMLHMGILAHHENWESFFKGLKYIVLDELHTYRGVFGSHVANVLRRLRRIARHYGADPLFISCSATIANPIEIAQMLTGLDFTLVQKSGAPIGKKNFLFLEPADSPYTSALKLFVEAINNDFKCITFTKARKITELIYRWAINQNPEISKKISSYRAEFLPEERRAIEDRLFNGSLAGVISTSALELGVDIGGLDICILIGYPGTISSTWQRAGRVGRTGKDSLVIMIAIEDALDKYFLRNPEAFFSGNAEAAVIDIDNLPIKKAHLLCAAHELQIKGDETVFNMKSSTAALKELEEEGKLRHWERGNIWYPRGKTRAPHRTVNLRSSGHTYKILLEDGTLLGFSGSGKVFNELHPGALYLHMGKQYRILSLHTLKLEATCKEVNTGYFTVARSDEETDIIETFSTKRMNGMTVSRGMIKVREKVTGYWIKDIYTREVIKEFDLDLPEEVFITAAVWMEITDNIIEEIESSGFSISGGLHALEHAQIAALPLFAMCDRLDLGGVSYTFNPTLKNSAIFIYDGHEGGVGLTLRGYTMFKDWLQATLTLMRECPCELSCPSCTQDQNCGNGNEPLDKRSAILILEKWLKL